MGPLGFRLLSLIVIQPWGLGHLHYHLPIPLLKTGTSVYLLGRQAWTTMIALQVVDMSRGTEQL